MRKFLLLLLSCSAWTAVNAAYAEKEYQVPVLAVRSSDNKGVFSRYQFKLVQTAKDKPAVIMVGNDTPGGAGEMQRSSIWLAASTAALLRNNSMKGVEISVTFSGNVDGPSAGAVICLAIMSALDGRDFPSDFAMTGTIMPDGTIGYVGGVDKKLMAAKKAGIKRVCIPAGRRRYYDSEDQKTYDFKKIAEENGLEFHEVDNIEQAYNIMHRLGDVKQQYISSRAITTLPAAMERKIEEFYESEINVWRKNVQRIFKGKKLSEMKNNLAWAFMNCEKSVRLRNKGRLLLAIKEMREPLAASMAYDDFAEELARIRSRYNGYEKNQQAKVNYLLDLISTAKRILKKEVIAPRLRDNAALKNQDKFEALVSDNTHRFTPFVSGSDIPAQLLEVNRYSDAVPYIKLANQKTPTKESLLKAKDLNKLVVLWEKVLFVTHIIGHMDSIDKARVEAFSSCLPHMGVKNNVDIIEHLFYNTGSAASRMYKITTYRALHEEWRKMLSAKLKRTFSEEETDNMLLNSNNDIASWYLAQFDSATMHSRKSKKYPNYHNIAAIKSHILFYTQAYALMNNFKDNDDISNLINHARRQAMVNISQCKEKNVPCLQAVIFFDEAEYSRDQENAKKSDKIKSLVKYWNASLMAKALEMSFSDREVSVPAPKANKPESSFDARRSPANSSSDALSSKSAVDDKLAQAIALYKTDKAAAFKLFSQCSRNNEVARYYLGVYYLNGSGGIRKNVQKAEEHFEFAISCEYLPAYFQMGFLLTGQKRLKEAVQYFSDGARKGNVECMWALGRFYYTGSKGVIKKDIKEARYWLQRAADKKYKRAEDDLANLDKQ